MPNRNYDDCNIMYDIIFLFDSNTQWSSMHIKIGAKLFHISFYTMVVCVGLSSWMNQNGGAILLR